MVPSRMFRSPLWFDVFLCFSCTLAVFGSPAMTSESEIPTPCDSSPCLNGGSCRDDWGFVECSGCDEGWQGNYCEQEIISPCANWTCHNGGSCYLRSWGTAYCDCQTAWQGDHCEQVIPQCVDWICLNGGTCNKDIWDGPICDCDLGWYGEHCDEWRGTSCKIYMHYSIKNPFS
ncbi:uncharacterized protein [Asterias amurensis]|uniref:uncharacterized protein n=1 Tax=Asterias amurensis TaxID=7602 RepID=UPI003AB8616A